MSVMGGTQVWKESQEMCREEEVESGGVVLGFSAETGARNGAVEGTQLSEL